MKRAEGDKKPFFISTAIPYINGPPHVGHAYEAIVTDAIARYHRLSGRPVFALTGVDEHGLKISRAAQQKQLSPQQFVNTITPLFQSLASTLSCRFDGFVRTSEERHKAACSELWQTLVRSGDIYQGLYKGWYSVQDEIFLDESEVQTLDCGAKASSSGAEVVWMEEPCFLFRLSDYQERLLQYFEENPAFVQPEFRFNEIKQFVRGGLRDLAVSRQSLDWGVPVPGNPGHVMYVWIDALTNYITALGYPDQNTPEFQMFWPADIHMIGKDITRFHAVFWPAFLMSAGLPLPRQIFSHGFFLSRGKKMSKSSGNVVEPNALVDTFGVDAVRYFFMRQVTFGSDGEFDDALLASRANADLSNALGNLAQRSLTFIHREYGGVAPPWKPDAQTTDDRTQLARTENILAEVCQAMDRLALHTALERIIGLVDETNRYFTRSEPWKFRKTNTDRMDTVLGVTLESLRQVGLLLQPFIPDGAGRLLDQLGIDQAHRSLNACCSSFRVNPDHRLGDPPTPLFPKIENR